MVEDVRAVDYIAVGAFGAAPCRQHTYGREACLAPLHQLLESFAKRTITEGANIEQRLPGVSGETKNEELEVLISDVR